MADPRLTPSRGDIAASHLQGTVEAERFVDGTDYVVSAAIAPLRRAPSHDAALDTEALRGERVTVYDIHEGWAWGQLAGDGYVGWLPEHALSRRAPKVTHKVTALRTFGFPGPSIKLPPRETLTLGAAINVARQADGFFVSDDGLFLPPQHLTTLDARESDFVDVAERFVATPYLWGGKSSLGIDCSGLVQLSLAACGIAAPRDSDMQETALGRSVPATEKNNLQRGDLIFWKGHVAIVRDASSIVHANAFHMATAIEPLAAAITRIAAAGQAVTGIRRLG
jgi:hypothetical protein